MYRVYFDWMVINQIRKNQNNESHYSNILKLISQNHFIIPFSPEHISDLKRNIKTKKFNQEQTNKDLDFLKKLTKNHFIYYDNKESSVTPTITNPFDYFDLFENPSELFDTNDVFPNQKNLDIEDFTKLKEVLDSFKLIPSGIDVEQINKDTKNIWQKEILKNTLKNNNFHSVLLDIIYLFSNPKLHSKTYREGRNQSIRDLKIETNPQKWEGPINYLDKKLNSLEIAKNTHELVKTILEKNKYTKDSGINYFITFFIILDSFGYYRDKHLYNLISDSIHSFYGAHCDYFITDDYNTLKKSEAIYSELKIKTIVSHSKEFLSHYYNSNELNSNKNFLNNLTSSIKSSIIIKNTVDNELNPTVLKKLKYPLLYFFDRMQITNYLDSDEIFLYKHHSNLSNFSFWTEIEFIINSLYEEFGKDMNSKGKYNPSKENQLITMSKWSGRKWVINENVECKLSFEEHPFNLVLNFIFAKK